MFYELIFESGTHSVAQYENDEEASQAIEAHQERAINGGIGGPSGHPAERIKKVLIYNEHPANHGESQAAVSERLVDAVGTFVREKAVGDIVSVPEVAALVRDYTSPVILNNHPHDSDFKMEEVGELAGSWQ